MISFSWYNYCVGSKRFSKGCRMIRRSLCGSVGVLEAGNSKISEWREKRSSIWIATTGS